MTKRILLILFLSLLLLLGCRPKEPLLVEVPAIIQDEGDDDVPVIAQEEQIADTVPESEEKDATSISIEETTTPQEEEEEQGFFSSLFEAFTNSMNEIADEQAKTEADETEELQQDEEEREVEKTEDTMAVIEQEEVTTESMEEEIVCSSNMYNCNHFSNWNEANNVYQECGGSGNDIHGLDTDDDGIPCETLSGAPEEETTEEEATSIKSKSYTCYSDAYNCANFDSYSEALEAYEACGGLSNDVHDLDRDHDGEPCESLN